MTSPELDTQQTILCAALRLFSERGYESTGVQELVDAAGITKPTLYYHFGSKAGVLGAVLGRHFASLHGRVADAARYVPDPAHYDRDVFPVLTEVCLACFSYAFEHPEFYRLQLALSFAPPESDGAHAVRAPREELFTLVEELMARIAEQHGNVGRHRRIAAALFLGHIDTRIALYLQGYGSLDEQSARETIHLFMHGIFA